MPDVPFTEKLSREYRQMFANAAIRPERLAEVRRAAAKIFAQASLTRYRAVAGETGLPAHVVGIVHCLECAFDFHRHLHNGDPLTGRTVRVPAGRPRAGEPPFSWERSAADALRLHGLDRWTDWSPAGIAYVLERYNGFGYRLYHPATPSPYLWGGSTAYARGKYAADGKWSDTLASRQCGGMTLLRFMLDDGLVTLEA
ncbi:peptidoglycan-binding protein [Solidesulfovibrio sp.]|uniref:peptidoglycan-binding protein n=1 Tax=Solidesulfovibrio sp. TaxID=2910990 RepID=UPI002620B0D8|nr:peptidoglycan-binding protein [Solidesulfovibrio sp.]